MALAMTRPWKHPKTGVYWLRKRVPLTIQHLVGKREEKKSLKTKDPLEAKSRLLRELTELEERWSNLTKGPVTLTEVEAHQLAQSVYAEWIRIYKDNPRDQRSWNTEIGVEGYWEPAPSNFPAHLIGAYTRAEWLQEKCFRTADDILSKVGLTVDEKSRRRLAWAVSAALQRASLKLKEMALGASSLDTTGLPSISSSAGTTVKATRVAITELVNGWIAEKKPAKKTVYEWTRVLRELETYLGHDNAALITSADLNNWKAKLLAEGRKPKTIRDAKIAPVRAVLQWGADNDRLPTNPAAKVVLDVKTVSTERKRSFRDEEAVLVLRSARGEDNIVLRWVPWLCAYTGARVAEVCQLRKEDVFEVEGIPCLRITAEAGPLKTSNSERIIPIHSALVAEGFLTFVATLPTGPIFRKLSPDKFGSRGGNGTKMLGRWVRSLGIEDLRISPNHSWRHRLKTLARKYGMSGDLVDAIVGHRQRTIGDGYGEFPISALQRELEKMPALQLG